MGTEEWNKMTPDEKREARFRRWLSPKGIRFRDKDAEKKYKERVKRFIDVINLKEPDRVPVILPIGFFPPYNAGLTLRDTMYDYEKLKYSWLKLLEDFELDAFPSPGLIYPGRVLDMIEHRLHNWPGHGLGDHVSSYQFIEGEYMRPEEYDEFIDDPSYFVLRRYLPRIASAFNGLEKLGSAVQAIGVPIGFMEQFADPHIRNSLETLLLASLEIKRWREVVNEVNRIAAETGIPQIRGAMSSAPFDRIGDFLRGTKGIMLDMYRRPEKLEKAIEKITPMIIENTLKVADTLDCPLVFIPLHKGAAGFMSNKQFERFYWPSLKEVMLAFTKVGLVPFLFAEGDYEPRLEIIRDMPKASVVWYFEVMDMKKAKEIVGKNSCIAGNLPVSMLYASSPLEIKEACRKLIETCGKGGGYILAASASIDRGNRENIRAMMEAAQEYGSYGSGST